VNVVPAGHVVELAGTRAGLALVTDSQTWASSFHEAPAKQFGGPEMLEGSVVSMGSEAQPAKSTRSNSLFIV